MSVPPELPPGWTEIRLPGFPSRAAYYARLRRGLRRPSSLRTYARRMVAVYAALIVVAWIVYAFVGGASIVIALGMTGGGLAVITVVARDAISGSTWTDES